MKKVVYVLCTGLILGFSACSSSPAENAQKKADEAANAAQEEAYEAVELEEAAEEEATNAVVDAVVADANELMAQVPMPELASSDAKKYANKIGNHVVEYVNAKDESTADSYATKVSNELAKVDELTAKGKISPADSQSIKEYAADLLLAAGLALI
jgi:hypothetical protein